MILAIYVVVFDFRLATKDAVRLFNDNTAVLPNKYSNVLCAEANIKILALRNKIEEKLTNVEKSCIYKIFNH